MSYPFQTISYHKYLDSIPKDGRHILAQQTEQQILVYQAYNPAIADFAMDHQCFGGSAYSYSRMSWIKPNFLWMMFRCGWAEKPNQERVLGIWIDKADFELILSQSVFSSYQEAIYCTRENWQQQLFENSVRLQWDPDHDIHGNKQERKAIQLGIKGDLLKRFGTEMIRSIVDVTDFVKAQKKHIDLKEIDQLLLPQEWIYLPEKEQVKRQIGLDHKFNV